MSGTTEKFSLRWNDFESSISSNIGQLRDAQDFLDVTLVCENDQVRAHKLVISACSPFFRNILNKNPHQNPLLYMKGVQMRDMESVLDFMYYGEVSIFQNDLNTFLAVAEDLQVKGLTQKNNKDCSESSETKKTVPLEENNSSKSIHDKYRKYHKSDVVSDSSSRSFQNQNSPIKVKSEIVDVSQEQHQQGDNSSNGNALVTEYVGDEEYTEDAYDDYEDYTNYNDNNQSLDLSKTGTSGAEDLSQYIINNSDSNIKEYTCALCQTFKARLPSKVKNHLEAIHFPGLFLYNCDICGKTLKGRNALNIHKSTTHSKKSFHSN